MRLDKFLSEAGIATRSELKKIIKAKQVSVNDEIITKADYKINEDKLLGPYFLSKDVIATVTHESEQNDIGNDEGTEIYQWKSEPVKVKDNDKFLKAFKSKVLMYLFEDVAKQYGSRLFEGCDDYTKYSSICKEFDKKGENIFSDDFINKYADKEE